MKIKSMFCLSVLACAAFVGCSEPQAITAPTYNSIEILSISSGDYDIRYRLDYEDGKADVSPVFVFPRTGKTNQWAIGRTSDGKYFVDGAEGCGLVDEVALIYVFDSGRCRVLVRSLDQELIDRIKNRGSVLNHVYQHIKDGVEE